MKLIRLATIDDARQIQEIYAPYCRPDCAVSFEISAPTVAEMEQRIEKTLEQFPWLVFVSDGSIIGYAYAMQHRLRAAYRWSVDTSVYVSSNAHGQGIGKTLYSAIFPILRLQGYINAYAGITLPNPASMSLHKSFGFTQICVYGQVGYKGDAWHDVAWLERRLQPRTVPPAEPRSLPILVAGGEFSLPELPSGGTGA